MKVLAVHPSGLMYTRVFLRLEPLGLESVAAAMRQTGHDVRLIDLQVESHRDLDRLIRDWRPDALCFSGNYLAKAVKLTLPDCFILVGGHSASFTASDMLRHAQGAIDCVLNGEGEASVNALLHAAEANGDLLAVPGAVTGEGSGPRTQRVLNRKHMGSAALRGAADQAVHLLMHGQTNFVRMLRRFNSVFDPRLQLSDHAREVHFTMTPPPATDETANVKAVYVHGPAGRKSRRIDDATERFVDETRMGAG